MMPQYSFSATESFKDGLPELFPTPFVVIFLDRFEMGYVLDPVPTVSVSEGFDSTPCVIVALSKRL